MIDQEHFGDTEEIKDQALGFDPASDEWSVGKRTGRAEPTGAE
jgi:hypothetical protein